MSRHRVFGLFGCLGAIQTTLLSLAAPGAADDCVRRQAYAHRLAQITPPNDPRFAAIQGHTAYVALFGGIWILDISDPAAPVPLGQGGPRSVYHLALAGDYAYTTGGDGFCVVDVSDPADVHVVSSLPLYGLQVIVSGLQIFTGNKVLDVSDPLNPRIVASTDGRVFGAGDGFCYAVQDSVMNVIDISTPGSPITVGSLPLPAPVGGASLGGRLVFISCADSIRIVDVSDAHAPFFTGVVPGGSPEIAASGSAACAIRQGSLDLIDAGDPAAPEVLGSFFSVWSAPVSVTVSGSVCITANSARNDFYTIYQVNLFEISAPGLVQRIGAVPWGNHVAASGNLAYLTGEGVRVMDVANPASPRMLGFVDAPGLDWDLAVRGSRVYLAAGRTGLQVFDVSTPQSPALMSTIPTATEVWSVTTSGSYLFASDMSARLEVFDLTDPDQPRLVATTPAPVSTGLSVAGGTLYMAGLASGLAVMDVSQPELPRLVASVDPGGTLRDVAVDGSHAYVTNMSELLVFDIHNPASPVMVGETRLPGRPAHLAVAGDVVYLAGEASGLLMVDVSDPTHPQLLAEGVGPAPTDVAVGNAVYAAGEPFAVFPGLCPATGRRTPPPVPVTPVLQLSQNRPNPFTGADSRIVIPFALTRSGQVTLRVFDVLGRPVRVLEDDFLEAGPHLAAWDGRDEAGRPTPSGIYFYRLEIPGHQATRRLLRLR